MNTTNQKTSDGLIACVGGCGKRLPYDRDWKKWKCNECRRKEFWNKIRNFFRLTF